MAKTIQNSTASSKILSESAGGQGEVCEMQNRPLPELRLQPPVADQFCKGPDGEASVQLGLAPRHDAGYFLKLVQELIPNRAALKSALAFAAGDLKTAFKKKTDYSAETIEGFFKQRFGELRNSLRADKVKEATRLLKETESGLEALRHAKEIQNKFSFPQLLYFEKELLILSVEIKKAKGEDIASSFLMERLDASISQFPEHYEFYLQRARASYRVFGDAAAAYRDFREAEGKSQIRGASEQEHSAILAEMRAFLLTHARASHEAKNYQAAAEYYGLAVKNASYPAQQREILLELKLFQQELRSLLPKTENLLNDAMHQDQVDMDLAVGLAKQRVAILAALHEIAISGMMPDTPSRNLSERLAGWSEYRQALEEAQALATGFNQVKAEHAVLVQLDTLAAQGYMADIAKFPEVAAFVGLTTAGGQTKLQFFESYQDLSYEKKLELWKVLGALGQLGQMKTAPKTPSLQKGYFEWKIDLAEGRVEAAKLKMVDFKTQVQAELSKDAKFLENNPEIHVFYEECRQQLRTFTLLAIEKLEAHNSALVQQRLAKLGMSTYDEQDARLNGKFLSVLKGFVKEEKADTLEEALAFMKAEHKGFGKYSEFVGENGQWTNIEVRDPDLQSLFNLETREAWRQMDTPEKRREYLLEEAKSLRHRNGSYEIAGDILLELLQGPLQQAIAKIPDSEKQRIAENTEAERPELARKIQKQLDQLKKDRPYEFSKRFPEGKPSDAEFQAMVAEGLKGRFVSELLKQALPKIDSWAEHLDEKDNPLSHDPIAREAWGIYEDMKDPLDRTWNLGDDAWDSIADFVIVTVVTAPLTMGVGSAVQAGVKGTMLIRGLVARGGIRWLASKAIPLASRGAAEALTNDALRGDLSLKSFGIQMLMTCAFHIGGKGWGQVANKLAIGEEAMKAAVREGKSILGLKVANFAGMTVTQTALSVAFDYAQEFVTGNDSGLKLSDRILGHGARQIGFHFGSKAFQKLSGGVFHEAEQRADAACEIARREYQRLIQTGASPDQAYAKALALSKKMIPEIWSGPPIGQVEPSIGKIFEPILVGLRRLLGHTETSSTANPRKAGLGPNQPSLVETFAAGVNAPMMIGMAWLGWLRWLGGILGLGTTKPKALPPPSGSEEGPSSPAEDGEGVLDGGPYRGGQKPILEGIPEKHTNVKKDALGRVVSFQLKQDEKLPKVTLPKKAVVVLFHDEGKISVTSTRPWKIADFTLPEGTVCEFDVNGTLLSVQLPTLPKTYFPLTGRNKRDYVQIHGMSIIKGSKIFFKPNRKVDRILLSGEFHETHEVKGAAYNSWDELTFDSDENVTMVNRRLISITGRELSELGIEKATLINDARGQKYQFVNHQHFMNQYWPPLSVVRFLYDAGYKGMEITIHGELTVAGHSFPFDTTLYFDSNDTLVLAKLSDDYLYSLPVLRGIAGDFEFTPGSTIAFRPDKSVESIFLKGSKGNGKQIIFDSNGNKK